MAITVSPFTKKIHAGLSLHSHAVRGVTVDESGRLTGSGEVTFPKAILTDDITDPKPLIAALTRLKTEAGFTSPYVAVTFPEKYAFSRTYRFPKLNRRDIAEAVNWQVDKIFPFAKEEVYVDWKLLEINQDSTLILATAVPRQLLDHMRLCLEHAGLYPISFEPSASVLSRLLTPVQAKEAVILELEANTVCLTLVKTGTSLSTATFNLTPQTNLPTLIQTISQSITQMAQKYLLKGSQSQATVPVYVTGEKAAPGTVNSLQPALRLPLQLFSVANVAPAYQLAYVAAKSYVLPPDSDQSINLLPTELQHYYAAQLQNQTAKQGLYAATSLAFAAVVLSVIGLGFSLVYLNTVNRAVAGLRLSTAAPVMGGINLAEVNLTSQRYVSLFQLKTSPDADLITLNQTLPPAITLKTIKYDAQTRQFTLTGVSQTRADLIEYKQALEQLESVKQVVLPLSALEVTDNVNFTLTVILKPKS